MLVFIVLWLLSALGSLLSPNVILVLPFLFLMYQVFAHYLWEQRFKVGKILSTVISVRLSLAKSSESNSLSPSLDLRLQSTCDRCHRLLLLLCLWGLLLHDWYRYCSVHMKETVVCFGVLLILSVSYLLDWSPSCWCLFLVGDGVLVSGAVVSCVEEMKG